MSGGVVDMDGIRAVMSTLYGREGDIAAVSTRSALLALRHAAMSPLLTASFPSLCRRHFIKIPSTLARGAALCARKAGSRPFWRKTIPTAKVQRRACFLPAAAPHAFSAVISSCVTPRLLPFKPVRDSDLQPRGGLEVQLFRLFLLTRMRTVEPFCNASLPIGEVAEFTENVVGGVLQFNTLALGLDGAQTNRLEVRARCGLIVGYRAIGVSPFLMFRVSAVTGAQCFPDPLLAGLASHTVLAIVRLVSETRSERKLHDGAAAAPHSRRHSAKQDPPGSCARRAQGGASLRQVRPYWICQAQGHCCTTACRAIACHALRPPPFALHAHSPSFTRTIFHAHRPLCSPYLLLTVPHRAYYPLPAPFPRPVP